MSIKFTFPKNPRVGDRVEILSTSDNKIPIELVGNLEAGKDISLIFPDGIKSGASDGTTIIASLQDKNILYTFRCISIEVAHIWLLETGPLSNEILQTKSEVAILSNGLQETQTKTGELETRIANLETEIQSLKEILEAMNGNAA